MNKPRPLVSVVLPAYNQESFIEESVLSAVNQDYDPLEVIVADDHSRDRTAEIIQELALKYPDRIVPVINEANLGIAGNMNKALLSCRGELIAFSAGDDLWLPRKIEKQVDYLLSHPQCPLVIHDVDVFDSNTMQSRFLWSQRYEIKAGIAKDLVRYGSYLPGVSVMTR